MSVARCKDIEEVQLLVNRCNSQLSVLKADKEAVFLHFSSFPKVTYRAAQRSLDVILCFAEGIASYRLHKVDYPS